MSSVASHVLSSSTRVEWFAVAAPGLETCLFHELSALFPDSARRSEAGGTTVWGSLETLFRANLESRTATRVLLRVGRFRALHFSELRKKAAALPWPRFAAPMVRLRVSVAAHKCRLFHSDAIAERVVSALGDSGVVQTQDPDAPLLHVFARGEQDEFLFSVDSSGELLHKRGYRQQDGHAPMRETLAPALLSLSGFDGQVALCDPMCGSGTLAIEAAHLALLRAPGLLRRFAFFDWPLFSKPVWETLVAHTKSNERPQPLAPIFASDHDPRMVDLARNNAERANVSQHIVFQTCSVKQLTLPTVKAGLIVCNPPYGKRLRDGQIVATYRSLFQLVRRHPAFRLFVFTPDPKLATAAGCPRRVETLHNGGLRVGLFAQPAPPAQPV
ncbi:MAG TPA: class I SAM-dependent RNA methyltransferase [Pseudomonadota bacterium]|mgnify:CR=1 FL=1|nr:class I SAM-dependent RNA methyltransferase [Pseudomonadota bacterium]